MDQISASAAKDMVFFMICAMLSTTPLLGGERDILYYARAVDPTMLVALSTIASEQASPTRETVKKVDQFLDYAASQ